MNYITYENIVNCLENGKQVLVFVHKRASTISTANDLIEIMRQNPGHEHLFESDKSYKMYGKVDRSSNEHVKELYSKGFGIHNAGMLRKDRTLTEELFEAGYIKVLCTTATLAWGVNLPAYCTIIKGTEIYDSNIGEFKDIGIFDIQQIFGRAGRPQYDTSGLGIILTVDKKVDRYVEMMNNQNDIESHLIQGIDNCLNAEIAGGTVTTITEALQWLKFTYLYQRLLKNPHHYGLGKNDLTEDPSGHAYLLNKVTEVCQKLHKYRLIVYHQNSEQLSSTDMGRIASNYYIDVSTLNQFLKNIKQEHNEQRLLYQMANSKEFEQLRVRPDEEQELLLLSREVCSFVQIDKSEVLSSYGKVLILLESYLRNVAIKEFSLIADMGYVVQNGTRIMRALSELCLNMNFAELTRHAIQWCKYIDKRMAPEQNPLR